MFLFSVLCSLAFAVEPLESVFGESPSVVMTPPLEPVVKYQYICVCKQTESNLCDYTDDGCLEKVTTLMDAIGNCFKEDNKGKCNSVKIYGEQIFNLTKQLSEYGTEEEKIDFAKTTNAITILGGTNAKLSIEYDPTFKSNCFNFKDIDVSYKPTIQPVINTPTKEIVEPTKEQTAEPSKEQPAEPSKEQPAEPSKEQPAEPSKEQPAEPSKEQPAEPSKEQPVEPSKEQPAEPSKEQPAEPSKEQPAEPSKEQPVEPSKEQPAEPSKEQPVEPSKEQPAEPSKEQPAEPSKEQPAEPSKEQPAEPSKEQPAEPSKEQPAEPSKEQPAEPSKEQPAEPSKEQPAEPSKEQPAEPSKEQPAEQSKEQPAEPSKEQPAEQSKEQPAEPSKEQPAEPSKEQPAEPSKEQPAEPSKEDIVPEKKESQIVEESIPSEMAGDASAGVGPKALLLSTKTYSNEISFENLSLINSPQNLELSDTLFNVKKLSTDLKSLPEADVKVSASISINDKVTAATFDTSSFSANTQKKTKSINIEKTTDVTFTLIDSIKIDAAPGVTQIPPTKVVLDNEAKNPTIDFSESFSSVSNKNDISIVVPFTPSEDNKITVTGPKDVIDTVPVKDDKGEPVEEKFITKTEVVPKAATTKGGLETGPIVGIVIACVVVVVIVILVIYCCACKGKNSGSSSSSSSVSSI